MKERMPEANPEVAEVSSEELVAWTRENARNMARFSIGQTPPPNFASERASDLEVARYLSGVQVDDKSLAQNIKEALDRNLADPDEAFQATSLTVAKVEAAKEIASPEQKGILERFSDKVTKEAGRLIASKSGKRGLAVVSGLSLVATACGQVAQGAEPSRPIDLETPTAVATEVRPTSTPFSPVPPTEIATPTPEVVRDEWQVSADGHIYYNETELYGGLFTINPENTTTYWEDLVKGLYRINLYLGDTTFSSRYPTEERFLDAISSGEPIEGLCIPIQHPTRLRQWQGAIGCSSPMGPVNLSSVAIVIDQPTREEMLAHGPSDSPPYIFFNERLGELYVEVIEREGNQILEFHFRRDVVYEEPYVRPLLPDGTQDDNLVAATELLNSWNFVIGLLPVRPPRDNPYLRDELNPPALIPTYNLTRIPTSYSSLSETDSSLIMLR